MNRRIDPDRVAAPPVPGGMSAPALRGHAIGMMVGTLIGGGWLVYALRRLTTAPQIALGLVGLGISLWLLARGVRFLAIASRLPTPDTETRGVSRRAWTWFWVNFVAEVVLLNVAVNLLAAPELHVYWLPAISLVVGLHFLPMAVFFNVPSYWGCGAAMSAVAVMLILLIHNEPSLAYPLITAEAVCNAFILWATAARRVRGTPRD